MSALEPSLYERVHDSRTLRVERSVGRGLVRGLSRLEVIGVERVPADGPVVLVMNHRSFLDGPLAFGFARRPVSFLVKHEAFVPVLRTVLRAAGQVPVVRERVDPAPVRLALEILRAGGAVGIYPEGTRGDGTVHTTKGGAAYLALRSGATVVPVAAHGTDHMLRGRGVRRRPARLTFGPPLPISRYPDNELLNRRPVNELAEQIRVRLAELVAATAPTPTESTAQGAPR